MSGAKLLAVIGRVSAILSMADTTAEAYNTVKDSHDLPDAFSVVAARLLIVGDIFESAKRHVEHEEDKGMNTATEEQQKEIFVAIKELSEVPPSVPDSECAFITCSPPQTELISVSQQLRSEKDLGPDLVASLASLAGLGFNQSDDEVAGDIDDETNDYYFKDSKYMIGDQSQLDEVKPTKLCCFCQYIFDHWLLNFHIKASRMRIPRNEYMFPHCKDPHSLKASADAGFDLDEPQRHAALSHCWGSAKLFSLTQQLLAPFQKEFPPDAISRTFEHAITTARYLGIDCLWIDSLCIIQDSAEYWRNESAMMPSTYELQALDIENVTGNDTGLDFLDFFDVRKDPRCLAADAEYTSDAEFQDEKQTNNIRECAHDTGSGNLVPSSTLDMEEESQFQGRIVLL
ncbi:hypothetical protein G7Y89_g10935 [Cudoniella acicularis]|uniref:Heterokaryon incompatibility domain-containing protein n=1 Tax=Cudoniella acicularis TaxID=354080 RepID=A0A8H4VYA7_9HELO|nr:hypothetical protein G7Y89_g10935 [Cudoniella acicularis]